MALLLERPCVKGAFSFSSIIKPRQIQISTVCLNWTVHSGLQSRMKTLSFAHLLIVVADSNKDTHLNRKHWFLSGLEPNFLILFLSD